MELSIGSSSARTRNGARRACPLAIKVCMLAFLCLSGFLVSPLVPAVHAATAPPPAFYVSTKGSDISGNGSISKPFATISHAVSLAVAGQTVIVEPGTYNEMVLITKQLTLMSLTAEPSTTIVNASGQPVGIAVVGTASAGTVVEGFTVMNADNEGIFVQNSLNVIIENNVVSNNGLKLQPGLGESKAIQLTGTSDSTVAGNTVVGNLYGGIGVADDGSVDPSFNSTAAPNSGIPAGTASPSNANLISGNLIANNHPNHCAIVVSAYNPNEGVANNIISYNNVIDNENGIIIAADSPNTAAINNTVIYNDILNNGEGGVVVHSNAPGDVVFGNSILYNVFNGNGYLPKLEGIIVGGEGNVPVANTTISGNFFQNEYYGVAIVLGTNTLIGPNTIYSTVNVAYNGTGVIHISAPGAQFVTKIETTLSTLTQIQTTTATQTVTTSSGGLNYTLAVAAAIVALVVGLIVGMVIRPTKKASGS